MEKPGADDGWGPATRVPAGSASSSAPAGNTSANPRGPLGPLGPNRNLTPAQSLAEISARASGDAQAAYRRGIATVAEPAPGQTLDQTSQWSAEQVTAAAPKGSGLPAWAALLVLVVLAGLGGAYDIISNNDGRVGFNYGIIVAAIVAMLLVRRSAMFPVIIAPPIVYTGASVVMLYARSGGLSNRKVLYDAAANWLVYGFPAIAAATAAVLIIAGVRLLLHK